MGSRRVPLPGGRAEARRGEAPLCRVIWRGARRNLLTMCAFLENFIGLGLARLPSWWLSSGLCVWGGLWLCSVVRRAGWECGMGRKNL
eukprot:scaffold25583_cov112-Isochrysis_galbana.AAC.1